MVLKTAFFKSGETFIGRRIFLNKYKFSIFLALFVEIFWQCYRNCILRVQRKVFRINVFWDNYICVNTLELLAENFWQGCGNCYQRVQMHVLNKSVFSKAFEFFKKKLWKFGDWFSITSSKMLSFCPEEPFVKKVSHWKKYNFNFFRTSSKKYVNFCREVFDRIVKTPLYVSRKTFWRKGSFDKKIEYTIVIQL